MQQIGGGYVWCHSLHSIRPLYINALYRILQTTLHSMAGKGGKKKIEVRHRAEK